MDWDAAIERNREALQRILAMLIAMAGLGKRQSAIGSRQSGSGLAQAADGHTVPDSRLPTADCRFLPRHLHRTVLRLLRPAEAAARRLVIVAARGLTVKPPRQRPRKTRSEQKAAHMVLRSLGIAVVVPHNMPQRGAGGKAKPRRTTGRKVTLPLFDPIRILKAGRTRTVPAHAAPRILSFNGAAPRRPSPPPRPDDPIDATRLRLRLQALGRALDDLPGQARRFARWKMRRERGLVRRISPLRPGRPPGLSAANRRRAAHEVHEVLADLQYFAVKALEQPDTS